MLILLIKYRVKTDRGSGITAGHRINVYWDDVAEDFEVHDFDNAADTTPTTITSGPDLGADRIDHERLTASRPIPYSFCDGSTLVSFAAQSTFPYVRRIDTANHFSCSLAVCDLQISDEVSLQGASDYVTPDGSVTVTATSSNGTIKYSIDYPEFDYETEGQADGFFPVLYAGEHIITAKDAIGCVDQITINITVPDFYNVKYILEYPDRNEIPSKIEILERGYEGDPIEVEGAADPLTLKYNGDGLINKFTPIIESEVRVRLMSLSNFYFIDLFTQDERKYQVRWYKNYGEFSSVFTPASLPTLNTWTNVNDVNTDWVVGSSTPNVTLPLTQFANNSDFIYTPYSFEAGRTYNFGYDFDVFYVNTTNRPFNIAIRIVDSGMNELYVKHVSTLAPGEIEFIAPDGADGISIKATAYVNNFNTGGEVVVTINSFVNNTEPVIEGATGFQLKWLGYVMPSNYRESYINPPYPIEIVATDGLIDLKNVDFSDRSGNYYRSDIKPLIAISDCLSKTDLGINILSAINQYEEDMDDDADSDPLNQCRFNPDTFYFNGEVKSAFDALWEIVKSFRSRLIQRDGKWLIYNVEQSPVDMDYREFSESGAYLTNGTISADIVDIDVAAASERVAIHKGAPTLEIIPAYGNLYFEHTLLKQPSLIKGYSFEESDITTMPDGLKVFNGWNVDISNAPGATYGIKKTKSFEGDYNFFISKQAIDSPAGINVGEATLLSQSFSIEYDSDDMFELRFDYAVLLGLTTSDRYVNPFWIRLKYYFKVGNYYYNVALGAWSDDETNKYNEIYVNSFNNDLKLEISDLFREVNELTTEIARIEIVFSSTKTIDFTSNNSDLTNLKAIDTVDVNPGKKIKGQFTYTNGFATSTQKSLYYVLLDGDDANDGLNKVRPDDYDSATNQKVWHLEEETRTFLKKPRGTILTDFPVIEKGVAFNYIDNVVLLHHPKGEIAPDDVTILRKNNSGIKIDWEETYLLNDVDITNINNSERTYINFYKKLTGYPTETWSRTYRAGSGTILELVSSDVLAQYKTASRKITGTFSTDREIRVNTLLNEINDNNRKFMFMGYELNDRRAEITFDIIELKDVVSDDESEEIDAGFTTGFSLGFRS